MFIPIFIGSVFLSSVSQILLKKSADIQHKNWLNDYLNVRVIAAYAMFFASTLITVFAYKYVPLSLGPVLESFGYIFVSVLSYIFLKERMNKKQIIGMILIVIGIIVVFLGREEIYELLKGKIYEFIKAF